MRKVEVCSYNEKWAQMFMEEAEKLNHIFRNEIVDIHHIGSTSVLGLKAKPTIDIMPVVNDINNVDKYNLEMQEIGYEPKGENGIPGRRYFQKGGDNRSHHVHIYQIGSYEIKRHLAFRDYLKSHTDEIKNYGELKEKLADIELKALEWYEENNNKSLNNRL
ncbi:GrpB family protein [Bacillus sp. 1NLA3E]|uniref:GrpB family protein n=1 Tax=Bacillus sp. 1NLA3E TaxID=666686 RepID=UPI000247EB45|nr:GrpB family protein [Bacillus sp. 1NLA3E]AGK54466.1 hypothetical protein B1NLA3E_13590 [Bacillus sp. 1NLA3E]